MYLLDNVGGPETSNGAFMGVGREEGGADAGERLVEVLNDDRGLAHGLAVVDEHGHLLVHGLDLRRSSLLLLWRSFSSRYSYLKPLKLSASFTRRANGLANMPSSFRLWLLWPAISQALVKDWTVP